MSEPLTPPRSDAAVAAATAGAVWSRCGFTLPELTIALALLIAVAAAGLNFAAGIAARQRLQSGCDLFVSAVERARSLAVSRNGSFAVRVGGDRSSFAVTPAQGEEYLSFWRQLPPGVRFEVFPKRPVTFHSRGTAAPAGSYALAGGGGRIRVVVAVSGRIRWEREK